MWEYLLYSGCCCRYIFFSIGVLKYVLCLSRGCDGCCVFCLNCEAWSCRFLCMGSVIVSSCICCTFMYCVACVAVLRDAFSMTCSSLMLIKNARGDHMEEAYFKACLMNVSFCLPHTVDVSAVIICNGLCACTEMLWMCALYVSFVSKVRPRTFWCVAMGSAALFILRFRLFLYSAGFWVNRV